MFLCIETATEICSVALCNEDRVISLREAQESKSHASRLSVFISEILEENGLRPTDLTAISVSKGPGSFTGLRIGVSTAKGLAYGANIPLIGICTLISMFYGVLPLAGKIKLPVEQAIFCPVIDAKGMEIYYSFFNFKGKLIKDITAEIIDENSFSGISNDLTIIFFGPGAKKCYNTTKITNKMLLEHYHISASDMMAPTVKALREQKFENIAYFEPFYLKDFIPSKPKRKMI